MERLDADLLYLVVNHTEKPSSTIARLACTCKHISNLCTARLWPRQAEVVAYDSVIPAELACSLLDRFRGSERELVKILAWCPGVQGVCCKLIDVAEKDELEVKFNLERSKDVEDPWDEWEFGDLLLGYDKEREVNDEENKRRDPGHTSPYSSFVSDIVETLFQDVDGNSRGLSFALFIPCGKHWSNSLRFFMFRGWLAPSALAVVQPKLAEEARDAAACPYCGSKVWNAAKALNPDMERSVTKCPMKDVAFCVCAQGHFFGFYRRKIVRQLADYGDFEDYDPLYNFMEQNYDDDEAALMYGDDAIDEDYLDDDGW